MKSEASKCPAKDVLLVSREDSCSTHRMLWLCVTLLFVCQAAVFAYLGNRATDLQPIANCSCPAADELPPASQSAASGPLSRSRRNPKGDSAVSVHKSGKAKDKTQKGQRKTRSDKHGTTTTSTTAAPPVTTGVPTSGGASGAPNVEFVHPRFKEEFLSGESENRDNPWVWLNAYSRIPVNAIQDFCSATKDYCPPGPPGPLGRMGPPGERGPRGDKGERGFPGEIGVRGPVGPIGPPGMRGPKGEMGKTGLPGLNGRDGVPGEPGLDGVPGRNGQDGTSGADGTPGMDGLPGLSGRDGIDGAPGLTGPAGEPGPIGPQGLTGPRGKPGRSGIPGVPGIPGVNTWVVNSTDPRRIVLVPPSIIGGEQNVSRLVVIREGENLRLRCGTAGNPRPEVAWLKSDGSLIPLGSWKTSDVLGPVLNITKIHREHMAHYMCVADNGIPPAAYRTFNVEVHFAPLIRVNTPSVGVANGTWAVLECHVEAFPESLCYWERFDGRSIETQHRASLRDYGKYQVHMTLNITITHPIDFGRYQCVSKNEMGITRGTISVFEIDPFFATPPPTLPGTKDVAVWGPSPPDMTDLDDVCPPPPECPRCPPASTEKCRSSGLGMFDILGRMDIRPLGNNSYPGFHNRTQDCVLSAIGKPVYHRFTDAPYGSWMRDALPRSGADADKYWATKYNSTYHLFEYANKTTFKRDNPLKNYTLPFAFKGHLHVVYNGSFYYHQQEEPRVIRYELATERNTVVKLPNATVSGNIFLYTQSQSYLDFAVDETGLWVMYGLQPNNNTAVAKLNPYSLEIEYVWNISLNNQRAGEMFVACGVLYAVDSVTERNTKIRFALDLFKNKLLDVELPFTNPFRKTTMVGYNARTKELYTWDKGNQLTYPVKSVDIGYNTPDNSLNELANERIEVSGPEAFKQDDWETDVEITR